MWLCTCVPVYMGIRRKGRSAITPSPSWPAVEAKRTVQSCQNGDCRVHGVAICYQGSRRKCGIYRRINGKRYTHDTPNCIGRNESKPVRPVRIGAPLAERRMTRGGNQSSSVSQSFIQSVSGPVSHAQPWIEPFGPLASSIRAFWTPATNHGCPVHSPSLSLSIIVSDTAPIRLLNLDVGDGALFLGRPPARQVAYADY